MKRFGVMLDMSRNAVMKVDEVINFARIIKSFGYNMIELYTEDTYEVENEPYFGYLRSRYTFEEQRKIVEECEKLGIEVIPCIQTLAHLNQIFRWEPYQSINDCHDILLCEEERTYELIENMIRTLRKNFKSHCIHIGMDEAEMLGLGEYLKRNGLVNRFELLSKHLKRVIDICHKYDFKPMMWSDMFFKLMNDGEYYSNGVNEEAKKLTPKEVSLVYWDYYHTNKSTYDRMIEGHQKFDNEIFFAGGSWTWSGFAPNNHYTLKTMLPAMESCKEHGIENIFITMWGDNGKECSFYSVLPCLFTIRKYYEGITDLEEIKKEFHELTQENYDDLMNLDAINLPLQNDDSVYNTSKYFLYNDIFNGYFDSLVQGNEVESYKKITKDLKEASNRSKKYSYIFNYLGSLSSVLELKVDYGIRLRRAYQSKDIETLKALTLEIDEMVRRINEFYNNFSYLWYKENKASGFDVQDIRLGGLIRRLEACKNRLNAYIEGKLDAIEELEQEILEYKGEGIPTNGARPYCNNYVKSVTPNVL